MTRCEDRDRTLRPIPHRLALLQPSPCRRVSVCGPLLETVPSAPGRHEQEASRKQRRATSHHTAPLAHLLAHPFNCDPFDFLVVCRSPLCTGHSFPRPLAQGHCSSCSRKAMHSELLAQGHALKAALTQSRARSKSRTRSKPHHSQACLAQGCRLAQSQSRARS